MVVLFRFIFSISWINCLFNFIYLYNYRYQYFKTKDFFLIIENNFFTILYCIFGTLFFTYFYSDTFSIYINGNGGFVGNYLNQTFLNS